MTKVIVEVGSLKVYIKESELGGSHAFYWKDDRSFGEQGPFPSVYDAMKDYAKIVKVEKSADVIDITRCRRRSV